MMHALLALPALAALAAGGPEFRVSFDASLRAEPANGRLVVYLIREGARLGAGQAPSEGPFWFDPQPMFGIDVHGLAPGAAAVVGAGATCFPGPLAELPAGTYRAQAVLDLARENSDWRREAGNLYSGIVTFTVKGGATPAPVLLAMKSVTGGGGAKPGEGVAVVEVVSERLTAFHEREMKLRAAVVAPVRAEAGRTYPAVYEMTGFGGDYVQTANGHARGRAPAGDTPGARLARAAYLVVLDAESGNGHTLLANSANNGPVGDALVHELIPELEKRFPLEPRAPARLLRGHSSGGWSAIWLAVTYPETFGAAWATSPDPVDFRRFQLVDIYSRPNMYLEQPPGAGVGGSDGPPMRDTPSLRRGERELMTIRQENAIEEVLGPRNTSGQQWDSWMAVFGPRGGDGNPAALYDSWTGEMTPGMSGAFRAYDIGSRLRSEPGRLGPILKQRVRIAVGDQDTYYLNEAVALLKHDLDALSFIHLPEGGHGYVKIVPGYDHGNIFGSSELRTIPGEMLEHLERNGLWAPEP